MTTKSKTGIRKPKKIISLPTVVVTPIEPTTNKEAATCHEWIQAMLEEFQSLSKQHKWELVLSHQNQHLTGYKWVYKIKRAS